MGSFFETTPTKTPHHLSLCEFEFSNFIYHCDTANKIRFKGILKRFKGFKPFLWANPNQGVAKNNGLEQTILGNIRNVMESFAIIEDSLTLL